MDKKISRGMTIEKIFSRFPDKSQKLSQEITNAGLHCVGCQAATWETLEAGMYGHGFSDKQIDGLVMKLNEILEEVIDATNITVTKRAADKFLKILKEEGKHGWALRFADKPGGCGGFEYQLDFSEKALDTDDVFHSNGIDIHVNQKMKSRLLGAVIDFLDGLNGSGFKITNPNVKGSCGCGNSQSY